MKPKSRLIKWVGDPRAVKEDLFGVPNWRYENSRVIAMDRGHERILRKGDAAEMETYLDRFGTEQQRPIPGTGLSQDYYWGDHWGMIQEMSLDDAMKLLRVQGSEFKDVTDVAHPEDVTNDLYVVPAKGKPYLATG